MVRFVKGQIICRLTNNLSFGQFPGPVQWMIDLGKMCTCKLAGRFCVDSIYPLNLANEKPQSESL